MCRDALKKTYSDRGGMELLKGIIEGAEPENPGNPGPSSSLPWCRCGRCRAMPLEIENVCCRKRPCVTAQDFFQSAVLDMNVLSISIVNRSDVFADDPDYIAHPAIGKQHIANGYCGSMAILAEQIEEWCHHV